MGMSRDSARLRLLCLGLSLGLHAWLLWPPVAEELPLQAPGALRWRLLPAPPSLEPTPAAPQLPPVSAGPARNARPVPTATAAKPAPPAGDAAPALAFPAPGNWDFRLRWQGEEGQARLRFESLGEGRYRLQLERRTATRKLPDWLSEGFMGPAGLQPQRFSAGRRAMLPPEGAQDRLSWIWQAAALAQSRALKPGQQLLMPVLGWRGEASPWLLLAESDPEAPGLLRLRRLLPEGAHLEQLLWLDPARAWQPVRLRLRFDDSERWELDGRDISPTLPDGE